MTDIKELLDSGTEKEYTISFTGSTDVITNDGLVAESLDLNQKILSGKDFVLGGCIASKFSIKVFNDIEFNLEGREIQVDLTMGTVTLHLFHGKIDTAEKDIDSPVITITAYDAFGFMNGYTCYIPSREIYVVRNEAINKIYEKAGIGRPNVADPRLRYDYYTITPVGKYMNPVEALRQICEISGVYGYIDGQGVIGYKTISEMECIIQFYDADLDGNGTHLYSEAHGAGFQHFPVVVEPNSTYRIENQAGTASIESVTVTDTDGTTHEYTNVTTPFYFTTTSVAKSVSICILNTTANKTYKWALYKNRKEPVEITRFLKTKHEDYETKVITGIIYKRISTDTSGAESVTETVYRNRENAYVIANNIILANCAYFGQILEDLAIRLTDIEQFTPVTSMPSLGLPGVVEVGDTVDNGEISTIVFERTLKGLQSLTDTYIANIGQAMTDKAVSSEGSGGEGGGGSSCNCTAITIEELEEILV